MVMARFQRLLGCDAGDLVPLHWQQVRELRDSGMDIGCHTYSHPNLARAAQAPCGSGGATVAKRDRRSHRKPGGSLHVPLRQAQGAFHGANSRRSSGRRLSDGGGRHVPRSARVGPAVQHLRVFADGDSIAKLDAKITGAYELVGWWQDHAPLSLMRMISPLDFER